MTTETVAYTYDNNGNQLTVTKVPYENGVPQTAQVTTCTYDKFNQLITTATPDGTNVTDSYNGEGLRVAKQVNGQTTQYVYDADKVVLELDGNGNQTACNVQGTSFISRTVDGTTLYYMYNGHADVTALLDTTGTIQGSYYYDAFGNITEQTGSVNNNITYAGYQYDKETGLYYCNSRMYDPSTARFLQEDTYSGKPNDPLSLNLYTYCHNEPLMYSDPSGHSWEITIDPTTCNGRNIDLSWAHGDFTVRVAEGTHVGSIKTGDSVFKETYEIGGSVGRIEVNNNIRSDVEVHNNGIVGRVDAGDGNRVSVNNEKVVGSIVAGNGSSLSVRNDGYIGSVSIGNKSSADIKNTVTGGIQNINIGANSKLGVDNSGVIKSISSGDNSGTSISNTKTGTIGSIKTGDNSTVTGKNDGIIGPVSLGSSSSISLSKSVPISSGSKMKIQENPDTTGGGDLPTGADMLGGESPYAAGGGGGGGGGGSSGEGETNGSITNDGTDNSLGADVVPGGTLQDAIDEKLAEINARTGAGNVTADNIQFSDKFSKPQYKNQVADRGWTNQSIADTINNPYKVETAATPNKATGNSVSLYYSDDVHYVAVDDVTGKVIQVSDLNKPDWKMDLSK